MSYIAPPTEVEIDLGSSPVYDKKITVVDAGVSPQSKIIVNPSGNAPTGLTSDEWQMDVLQFAAVAGNGQFTLFVAAVPGPVMGKRKIYYSLS